LINKHLAASSITLLNCKIENVFLLFNFVHSCSIREVLYLSRWNALLLFHPFYRLLNVGVFLNSKLLQVLIKLVDASMKLLGGLVELKLQLVLVSLDFSVLEVFHSGNGICPLLLILLPVFVPFRHPLVHKLFVFLELSPL
jgi:hypothetical protein